MRATTGIVPQPLVAFGPDGEIVEGDWPGSAVTFVPEICRKMSSSACCEVAAPAQVWRLSTPAWMARKSPRYELGGTKF